MAAHARSPPADPSAEGQRPGGRDDHHRTGLRPDAGVIAPGRRRRARTVNVHRRPHVGVLATGDEVRGRGADLGPAGIPDANGPGLMAMVEAAGGDPVTSASPRTDSTTSGHASARVSSAAPTRSSSRVASRSGRTTWCETRFETSARSSSGGSPSSPASRSRSGPRGPPGTVPDAADLLFGLPGNPVSTFVTFELFVRPALRAARPARDDDLYRPVDRGVLADPVSKSHGRRVHPRRATATRRGPRSRRRGRVPVHLAGEQGSHVISALAAADALAVIPEADDSLPAGAEVELWWLDRA